MITHEIGHHVQNLLGILPRVQQAQRRVDQVDANQLQVRVELQADWQEYGPTARRRSGVSSSRAMLKRRYKQHLP